MPSDSFSPADHAILVVDDTAANRRLYGTLLEKAGFNVRTAADGHAALEALESEPCSLMLLDFLMPGMDAPEVLEKLRGNPKTAHLPVVVLTGSAEPDHIDQALEAGANDYITKPVNAKILVARVMAMIQAERTRERVYTKQKEALLEELEEAAQVQQAQLPAVPVRFADFRITGVLAPSGQVGGDVFDLVTTDDGRLVAVLIDVSGHGTASALVAAETRAEFRTLVSSRSLLESVQRLNSHLALRQTGKFCCLAAIEVDGPIVRILNAGLPPVVVLRGNRAARDVWGSGMPLGMFEDAVYELQEVRLLAGDRIIMLSDGLTEPFGKTDESLAAIDRLSLWPSVKDDIPEAGALRAKIAGLVRASAPELRDDATLVLLHLTGSIHETLRLAARPAAIPRAVRWVVDQAPVWADSFAIDHGLTEALTNAVVHGALGLDSDVRESEDFADFLTLANELPDRQGYLDRHVELHVVKSQTSFGIRIAWQGVPCPPDARLPALVDEDPRGSGMGTRLIHSLFDRVVWDDDGLGVELWTHDPASRSGD